MSKYKGKHGGKKGQKIRAWVDPPPIIRAMPERKRFFTIAVFPKNSIQSDILSRFSSFSYFQFLAEQDMPPPPQLLRPTPLLRAATTTGTQVRTFKTSVNIHSHNLMTDYFELPSEPHTHHEQRPCMSSVFVQESNFLLRTMCHQR